MAIRNKTGSYLAHSNLPPNRSVIRSKYAFAVHLSIFEPKILEIFESEIRQYTLDLGPQGPQIHSNFLFAIVFCSWIVLWYFTSATFCNKQFHLPNQFSINVFYNKITPLDHGNKTIWCTFFSFSSAQNFDISNSVRVSTPPLSPGGMISCCSCDNSPASNSTG